MGYVAETQSLEYIGYNMIMCATPACEPCGTSQVIKDIVTASLIWRSGELQARVTGEQFRCNAAALDLWFA